MPKNDHKICHACISIRLELRSHGTDFREVLYLSAWNFVPTERIFMKFYIYPFGTSFPRNGISWSFISIRLELRSQGTDFHEVLYLSIFRQCVKKKFQFHYSVRRTTGTWHEDLCTFMMSLWTLLIMRNISCKIYWDNQNTHFVFSNVFFRK